MKVTISRNALRIPGFIVQINKLIVSNYWTRLSKILSFVSGEQINYLPKPKTEANKLLICETLTNHDILQ